MAAGIFLIILVLAMVYAAFPTALFVVIFGLFLHGRVPDRPVVVLIVTLIVTLAAYVASVALLFVGMIALGNAT